MQSLYKSRPTGSFIFIESLKRILIILGNNVLIRSKKCFKNNSKNFLCSSYKPTLYNISDRYFINLLIYYLTAMHECLLSLFSFRKVRIEHRRACILGYIARGQQMIYLVLNPKKFRKSKNLTALSYSE